MQNSWNYIFPLIFLSRREKQNQKEDTNTEIRQIDKFPK